MLTFPLDVEAVHDLGPLVVDLSVLLLLLSLGCGADHEDAAVVVRLPLLAVGFAEFT